MVPLLAVSTVTLALVWWLVGADERRIDRACGTWLEERPSLRTAVMETEEAVGRAQADGSNEAGPYFNNLDRSRSALDQWERLSPDVRAELDESTDASDLERRAVLTFSELGKGVTDLRDQIANGDLDELLMWTLEVRERFQNFDDVCLESARAG